MSDIIYPPEAYVQDTGTEKGRGVFAARDYSKGEVIDTCPVVVLYRRFDQLPPKLKTLVYNWGALTAASKPASALVLGFGSLYNHDNPANMCYQADAEELVMRYVAARDITKAEELTVNYNATHGKPDSDDDNWFRRNDIKPIVS